MDITLEQIIRQYVHLPSYTNSKGWYPVLCKVCNDHGKKGKRAGFRFDGNVIAYHCFNCTHAATYDPTTFSGMPEKMRIVLDAFSIPQSDVDKVLFEALKQQHEFGTRPQKKRADATIEPLEVTLPSFFVPLDDSGDELHLHAIDYLEKERLISWREHKFYIGVSTSHPDAKRWHARLIIPVYKDSKLIFYQGRDLTGVRRKKYLSLNIQRDNILYGYDQLFAQTEQPLYVVEGWFDAVLLNGVAVFGNKFTEGQIKWLTKSPRKKVIIPDQFGNGQILADQAIEHGWSVSTPFMCSDAKDITEGVQRYGKLYTLNAIRESTVSGFAAQVATRIYCKK